MVDRVLVIGGGGFLGRHVVDAFIQEGTAVSVMDIAPPPGTLDNAVDWLTGSITDISLVASAAMGCDAVVFLANSSLPGSSHVDLSVEVRAHVEGTIKVAEVCSSLGVRRFVFASSGGAVYGFDPEVGQALQEDMPTLPRNAYGASKLAIEHYLRLLSTMRELKTVSLRVANPYGEGQRALRAQGVIAAAMQHAMAGTVMPIWGDGLVERDFLYVSDVARAFVAAATHSRSDGLINIGSGRSVSLRDILSLVEAAIGKQLKVAYYPDRQIDVRRSVLDITRAREQLGWEPKIELEEGLSRTAAWWLSQNNKR